MRTRWQEKFDFAFTRIQMRGIAVITLAVILISVVLYSARLKFRSDDYPVISANIEQAAEKIDPNTADFASLRRLPLMGDSRAMTLIKYRQANMPPGGILFTKPEDLTKIKGIGPGMIARWKGYLIFPNRIGDQ